MSLNCSLTNGGDMITYSTNWMGPIATRWYED